MKTFLKYTWIFIASLLVCIIISPVRGGFLEIFGLAGFPLSCLFYLIAYFSLTLFFLYKYGNQLKIWAIILLILLGATNFELYVRVVRFETMLASLPDFLVRVLSIFIALLVFLIKNKKFRVVVGSLYFLSVIWLSIIGYNFWLHYLNFDTFTGRISETLPTQTFIVDDSEGNKINLADSRGKIIVLDFWNSSCGVCFQKFPMVQEIHNYYQENDKVEVISVFCRMTNKEETAADGIRILNESGFTFPCVSVDIKDPILESIGVTVYPTVIVLNQDKEIEYRGRIEGVKKIIDKLH